MAKPKLLLHVCCASCAAYVFSVLEKDYDVTGYFYNPNIHPQKEYLSRKGELTRLAKLKKLPIIFAEYNMKEWFKEVEGLEKEPEKGLRCTKCFYMRLDKTFEYAKTNNFDMVASTLSISPYKVTRQINQVGEQLAKIYGISFLPENFKKKDGYNIAKKMAMDLGIQHQNFCGCVYSKVEKILRTRRTN
jgi:predicted adenine nucleotide alpha hydrolase (AANH) superfamily ATPase